MATRYVTLKDSNGDTIYPQSVISQVANGAVTTNLIADGAVTSAKIDWTTVTNNSISSISTGGYGPSDSGTYAKLFKLDMSANWKTTSIRFTLASTQSSDFIYDVMLSINRSSGAVGGVTMTAWKLKTTTHDLSTKLKLVAVSSTQFELYFYMDSGAYSPAATVYSFTSYDTRYDNYGKLTMYTDVRVNSLPSGTQYSCTVKNNLIS